MSELNILPIDRLSAFLKLRGADLIEDAVHLSESFRTNKPALFSMHLEDVRETIAALDRAISAYERETSSEDEHKAEVAAGVADFMAFRDARGNV